MTGRVSRRRSTARTRRLLMEPLESRVVLDSTVVFNEVMYNPAGQSDHLLEWIELYNHLAVDMDISEWSIEGGVDYTFPDQTVVPGRGFLIVSVSPADFEAATGYADALGPYEGRLANDGEQLRLINNDNREMNVLNYRDAGDWPVGADGSGATLAKRDPDSASEPAENWTHSTQVGGTPGQHNFPKSLNPLSTPTLLPIAASWKYEASGTDLQTAWRAADYDDGAWDSNATLLPPVLITEVNTGQYDSLEIQNLSGSNVDTSGWIVAVNNARTGVNDVNPKTWHLPDSMGADELWFRTDDARDTAHDWGEDIFWRTVGPGWVMILNADGAVVDYVIWGYPDGYFETFDVQIPVPDTVDQTLHVTAGDFWEGSALPTPSSDGRTHQRIGVADHDGAADWSPRNPSPKFANQGLIVPFPGSGMRLPSGPTTYYFRTEFDLNYSPDLTDLTLDTVIDDGAVLYLNGVELFRQNMPSGTISYDTPARTEVVDARLTQSIAVPNNSLLHGRNVLAAEVHQIRPNDVDVAFGAELSATFWPPDPRGPSFNLALNEVGIGGRTDFYVELANRGRGTVALEGHVIASSDGGEYVFSSGSIAPGQVVAVDADELGFSVADGEKVNLYTPGQAGLIDAVLVDDNARGRSPDGTGSWAYNATDNPGTPGAANEFTFHDEIVINEIMYHAFPILTTWDDQFQVVTPFSDSPEEWIELYNRSDREVDLTGWRFDDGVGFSFTAGTKIPAGGYLVVANDVATLRAKYPGAAIVGSFSGTLNNRDDRVRLLDDLGNVADEVHYYDSGHWPSYADGGGSSLELRDPDSDNSRAEAWASSDESGKSQWKTYTVEKISKEPLSIGAPFNEFVFGLLDAGEFLLDDVSVRRDPGGANAEMIQNGTFQADAIGSSAAKWRIIGNHHGTVIADPDKAGNRVLHVVADGAQQHLHDHAETTFVNNTSVGNNTLYKISFKAKWLAGSNQVNNRLYYTRAGNTVHLDVPELNGTPGAQNSTFVENVGPTYDDFGHAPILPRSSQDVTVSVDIADPQGVQSAKLYWRYDGGSWRSVTMSPDAAGVYSGTIPRQNAGRVVQFYVESRDDLGAVSTMPAAGPDSRVLYQVDDGRNPNRPIDNIRIVLMAADNRTLVPPGTRNNDARNMSNQYAPGTMIHTLRDGNELRYKAFYDVGVRQTGSRWIRPNSGYKVLFNRDEKFYGVHTSIRMDMNQIDEIYMKQMVNRAGGSNVSMYDDVAYMITPQHGTRTSLLQMARYQDVFLEEQFADGNDGTVWELDDVVYPTGGPLEGTKDGTGVSAQDIRYRGEDPEAYRGQLLIKNNRAHDDYGKMVEMARAINRNGQSLYDATQEVMDVDLWMRHYATQCFLGNWDTWGCGRPKNLRIYARPEDGMLIPLYWDADLANFSEPLLDYSSTSRLDEIRDLPQNIRLFWGHMVDLADTGFNGAYIGPWISHYASLGIGGMASAGTINNRANQARNAARSAIPEVPFRVTTNDGQPLEVHDVSARIGGDGWINVRQIRLRRGTDQEPTWSDPLDVTWIDRNSWQVDVPLAPGDNALVFEAFGFNEESLGTAQIAVSSTVSERPLQQYLRISEIMYAPAELSQAERDAGYGNPEDFEFVELMNVSGDVDLNLNSVAFVDGVALTVDDDVALAAGERVVVVRNQEAFEFRYGTEPRVIGQYEQRLRNEGEDIRLVDPAGGEILNFEYASAGRWPGRADGKGAALEMALPYETAAADYGNSEVWQSSIRFGGTPGAEPAAATGVVINEVLTHTDFPLVDAIELHNTNDAPVDVGGWYLSDSWGWESSTGNGDYQKFRIPDGTVIPPRGYAVLYEGHYDGGNPPVMRIDQTTEFGGPVDGTDPKDFGLSGAAGDHVWLMAADAQGNLTHFADHVDFPAAPNGESFGRWPNGSGNEVFPMAERTLGDVNSEPRIGPLVITEVMYRPPQDAAGKDLSHEFIEIQNVSGAAVPLFDPDLPESTWRIAGIGFLFPEGEEMPAGGVALVVPIDPEEFRTTYDVPASVQIFGPYGGPYSGVLDNDGERVQLLRPDEPTPTEPPVLPWLLVDEIDYLPGEGWPVEAAGDGMSLQRVDATAPGAYAESWVAADPTPGRLTGASVVGRYVFYNNSSFDGNDPGADATDDDAIAPDKTALQPGQTATVANYTNFGPGINGVMIDVVGLPAEMEPGPADFRFAVGNSNDTSIWAAAPQPASITVRRGDGVDTSDRVTLVWEDNAIRREWLQVTVLGASFGLSSDDVFYFGNAVAEAGNLAENAQVTTTDVLLARNNPRNFLDPAEIDYAYDYNRDQRVNATDVLLARNNVTNFLNALRLLDLSAGGAGLAPASADASEPTDESVDRLMSDFDS